MSAGNLYSATLNTVGAGAGVVFKSRDDNTAWQWYSTSGTARLFDSFGDRFTVAQTTGNISTNGGAAALGATTVTTLGATGPFTSGSTTPAHIITAQTTPPALTSCNQGGGSPTIVGTDTAGEVTTGTLATSCVFTFNAPYNSAPFCTVTWQASLASTAYTVSNSAITFTQTATTGEKVNYHCIARSGG